uniref:Uncharacterized protein n=2 Tax=Cajanus cajan TaxID=3821 RepID=A0A151RFL8_CAJCA|nr:hypothetical protein KK1_037355 [Cajanus cajan]
MTTQTKDPTQDPSNPLFLHHSDGPGLVLTSQPLDHKNYTTWSRAMHVALSVKNKLAFIDETLPKPAATDSTFAAWNRGNNVVISWLYNSVSKDIITSILFATTAKEIWDDLKTRFSRKNGPRIFQLRRQLINKSGFTKKERPKCAHCEMFGHTKDKCYKLVGYPPNYFKNRQPKVVNQVENSTDSLNLNSSSNLTHAQCQQLITFLTNQMQSDNNLDALATNVTGICMNVKFPDKDNTWIIDLGATSHICCSKHMYNSYSPLHNSNVLLPNSTKVKVEGIGSIRLNDDIFLHNVLHIPTFRFNLLSLLTLINENCFRFVLDTNSCILQDLKTLRKIGIVKQRHGLLLFDFPKSGLNPV